MARAQGQQGFPICSCSSRASRLSPMPSPMTPRPSIIPMEMLCPGVFLMEDRGRRSNVLRTARPRWCSPLVRRRNVRCLPPSQPAPSRSLRLQAAHLLFGGSRLVPMAIFGSLRPVRRSWDETPLVARSPNFPSLRSFKRPLRLRSALITTSGSWQAMPKTGLTDLYLLILGLLGPAA